LTKAPKSAPQRNQEACIHRHEEHEIERARRTFSESLTQLVMNSAVHNCWMRVVGADEEDHLPLGPGRDSLGVPVDHRHENQLQRKPQQFNHDPEQEIDLESHLPDDELRQNAP
jgi:hypothetical protein